MSLQEETMMPSAVEAAAALAALGEAGSNLALAAFVRAFYQHVPPTDIAGREPHVLAAAAAAMWHFVAERPAGRPKIEVAPMGFDGSGSVVRIVTDDMRFLVDSVDAALSGLGFMAELIIHPVLQVTRDEAGRLLACAPALSDGARESMMSIELADGISQSRREAVVHRLEAVLSDVRHTVADWTAMRHAVLAIADEIADATHISGAEDAALLRWLDAANFLFLGTREYTFRGSELAVLPGRGLGLLRDDDFLVFDGLRALTRSSPDVQAFLRAPRLTMISKASRASTVHRPVAMDTVIVKSFDQNGNVRGLRLIVGLFTVDSYFRLPHEIPVLRQKVKNCQDRAGLAIDGRDARMLQHILDEFPRDELFQIDETQLFETALGVLHLKQRPRLALFVLRDPFERFATCLVYVPRDRFNAEVTRRLASILAQAFGGNITHESSHLDDAALARLHYVIALPAGSAGDVAVPAVERRLTEALRTWADRLGEMLPRGDAGQRLRRYATAFPASYIDRYPVEVAVGDAVFIDQVLEGATLAVALSRDAESLRLRVFHLASPLALSDVLPMLENLGMRVITEIPFEVTPREAAQPVWVQELELAVRERVTAELDAVIPHFEQVFRQIWAGTLENDGFNRLVLTAGLSAREVVVVRTYAKLLRQAGSSFSQAYMEDTVSAYPGLSRLLVRLFDRRADPKLTEEARAADIAAIHAEILAELERVENLDEDRILRSFLLLIDNTLRTNFYQCDTTGGEKPYLSVKIASSEVELLPLPRPLVEIFVYSPRMEGCHLRGGRVARGGIRWSDRKEDFRTEILGLLKAQMVKNAVIVPIGSKGGFVVKRPPEGGRDAQLAEAIACYRTLMSGLLDLTDNIVNGVVVPPTDVVRHDGDDIYLVVAADKGTATFSDIANNVAIDYGFWLGDAFASGGSVGYDHKIMGITAKGAWEAVKRHFRELGRDIQRQDFSCVGVGDMSGDVFGNGMLLSRHTRLIAAFNHVHIFIDPEPDPERSWIERQRLFARPGSGWQDYDASLLSQGGAVYERRAKSISLSPQAAGRLGLRTTPMAPAELIQALLCQDIDLLWFGGIGTYVKAVTESHTDAGDRANDSLRVDATALRAKVVGEGANLAVTQRARIAFALAGGRINTDAIDNSAGVDTSDHEVNVKIAVGDAIVAGLIPPAERAAFLASMTDDVEHLVLADNYLQTQALTLAQAEAPRLLPGHVRLMRTMERHGRLDRAVEFLPDDETLAQRSAAGRGLTRPEIAVLLAYAKNGLYDALLETDVPDRTELGTTLLGYFPRRLRELAPAPLAAHRLRREIVATCVANALINRMGPAFVEDTRARNGRDVASVVAAWLIVVEMFELPALWRDVEALDNVVAAATQTQLLLAIAVVVDQAVRWFLSSGLELVIGARVEQFRPGVRILAGALVDLLPIAERELSLQRQTAYRDIGAPPAIAERIVVLNTLSNAMDIVQISEETGGSVTDIARAYFRIGVDLGLLLLRRQARQMPGATEWQRLAADALLDDAYAQQREIVSRLARSMLNLGDVEAWTRQCIGSNSQLQDVLTEVARTSPPDLAMLTVASRRIRAAFISPPA
jgi:glutamate dehydrogenase